MSLRAWAGLATSATSATASTCDGPRVANVATVATPARTREVYRRWRVTTTAGAPLEVLFTPDTTAQQVAAIYPGASLQSLPDAPKRQAMPAEAVELRELVAVVLADASDAERAEALRVALADVEAALTSLRALTHDTR